jgi:hypothetical protein
MSVDGEDGKPGLPGADGVDGKPIVWKGDLKDPPTDPELN